MVHGTDCPGGAGSVVPGCDSGRVRFAFDAELWIWDARRDDSWTFLSLPADASDEIRDLAEAGAPRRGFGSVRVRVSIGGSTWSTSVFPDGARGVYVLPVKKAVRRAEGIEAGDVAGVTVEVI
ncbi:DUF1905 domain-containing protein [Virgisporangium aurantiacum]|uniref:DUF1905 domain-containing protein n=1 Tax=Virgisporangium aurantiacum TaxID=175570 RepID=UPI0035711D2F